MITIIETFFTTTFYTLAKNDYLLEDHPIGDLIKSKVEIDEEIVCPVYDSIMDIRVILTENIRQRIARRFYYCLCNLENLAGPNLRGEDLETYSYLATEKLLSQNSIFSGGESVHLNYDRATEKQRMVAIEKELHKVFKDPSYKNLPRYNDYDLSNIVDILTILEEFDKEEDREIKDLVSASEETLKKAKEVIKNTDHSSNMDIMDEFALAFMFLVFSVTIIIICLVSDSYNHALLALPISAVAYLIKWDKRFKSFRTNSHLNPNYQKDLNEYIRNSQNQIASFQAEENNRTLKALAKNIEEQTEIAKWDWLVSGFGQKRNVK